jgi:hypothetical protein
MGYNTAIFQMQKIWRPRRARLARSDVFKNEANIRRHESKEHFGPAKHAYHEISNWMNG